MEPEIVSTGLLNEADFTTLIATCTFLQGAFVFMEQLPQQIINTTKERQELLLSKQFNASFPFAQYTSGRIFQHDFELRWEKQARDNIRIVYIGTERNIPLLKVKRDLSLKKKGPPHAYYLFGQRLRPKSIEQIGAPAATGDFAELRIPRLLHYPVGQEGRYPRIYIQEYVNTETNRVELFRFVDVKATGQVEQ